MNLPNKLTVSRFVLTAAFLAVIFSPRVQFRETVALVLFSVASLTEPFVVEIRWLPLTEFALWAVTLFALSAFPAEVAAEGDLVTLMWRVPRPEPKDKSKTYDSYWFDMFRIKDGKLVEHWDNALK